MRHTKSRKGCIRCKARHVKCDEMRPCSNCVRRKQECDLISPGAAGPDTVIEKYNKTGSSLAWSRDIYLMHHYTKHTAATFLSSNPTMAKLWEEDITELAMDHPHLLHGLLALAAMHLADTRTTERSVWIQSALQHQNIALTFFRATLPSLNERNVYPTFALSMTLCGTSVAYSKYASHPNEAGIVPIGDIIEPLVHVKGLFHLLKIGGKWLVSGPLSQFTREVECQPSETLPLSAREQLGRLREMIKDLDPPTLNAGSLSEAVEVLETIYCKSVGAANTVYMHPRLVWKWGAMISQNYLSLLRGNYPPALVIFAHFTILFAIFEREWYFSGYAERALRAVSAALPEKWRSFLDWPKLQLEEELQGILHV